MKRIFEQGYLNSYSQVSLYEARSSILKHSQFGNQKTAVFISHKHDDLDDLKGLIGFLKHNYNVDVYIDSQDPSMPVVTSAETAINIKERIKECDKFILLATNGAIESKWCNWELGYGDAQKYNKSIALFPIKPKGTFDKDYKGSEYMSIYPYIAYFDGTEKYTTGELVDKGYYVCTEGKTKNNIISLGEWLSRI